MIGRAKSDFVQANARVPKEGRPFLLAVAARLRDDTGFLARLKDFLADDASASPWVDRFTVLEKRVAELEAGLNLTTKPLSAEPVADENGSAPSGTGNPYGRSGKPGNGINVDNVHVDSEARPATGHAPDNWAERATAITISTGEGRGRKLTDAGAALFEEMVLAGVRHPDIARTLGMARQSVDTRAKKIAAGG